MQPQAAGIGALCQDKRPPHAIVEIAVPATRPKQDTPLRVAARDSVHIVYDAAVIVVVYGMDVSLLHIYDICHAYRSPVLEHSLLIAHFREPDQFRQTVVIRSGSARACREQKVIFASDHYAHTIIVMALHPQLVTIVPKPSSFLYP